MTISLWVVIALVWMHFIADFVFQSDWVATKKSKDSVVLLFHVLLYTIPMFVFGWTFAVVNMILHFCVDFVTSRMTTKLWLSNQRHWFFVTIGLDQALHMSCLFITYYFLANPLYF